MEQIVVKTEMQENGEILLFYMDENEAGSVNIENQLLQMEDGTSFEIKQLQEGQEITEATVETADWAEVVEQPSKDKWTDEEVQRLLVFFIDNKNTFVSSTSKKKHVWSVACKTMLIGKTPQSCEMKIRNLKRKYSTLLMEQQRGVEVTFPLFELCHQAFHDDAYVQYLLQEQTEETPQVKVPILKTEGEPNGGMFVVKTVNAKPTKDSSVEMMLKLYLRYKKNFQKEYWRRGLWETIAMELGEEDADYWHRRFLNFKQHYLRMIAKRQTDGPDSINWPYMSLFDQIFQNDQEFNNKYGIENKVGSENGNFIGTDATAGHEWNDTENTILAKYYFDCFDEFQDPTIPDDFLWNEIGRLLGRKPNSCKQQYSDMRKEHLEQYNQGNYNLRTRIPLAILYDNIISQEVEILLASSYVPHDKWKDDEVDELVQFMYENMEAFKDPVCFNVCWACVAAKFNKSVVSCKKQWDDLKKLYVSVLEDKKENPDIQVEGKYIELFDRIFDYGMDTNLLNDFQQYKEQNNAKQQVQKIGVKKVNIKLENDPADIISEDEEYDERGFTKRTKRGVGDSKAFKILEYYQKNKDKFSTTLRKKQVLWETLAKQIGISGEQCAHRFRNLKQVYTAYVQREINKPEMPILWPYYALCKKVFGYRAIRSKLKNNKVDSEDTEEWSAKEIKQIINYFADNFTEITTSGDNDSSRFARLAVEMGKSVNSVNEKYLELQKSYRRLKTMKQNSPECKVSWKYYNMFDDIYARVGDEMDYEEIEMEVLEYDDTEVVEKTDSQDEDDYQCIIVIPEGQELSDISNAQIITSKGEADDNVPTKQIITKWNKRTKKKLLLLYLNYLRSNKGKEINPRDMWTEIASKLPEKTPWSCKKMFIKLKSNHLKMAAEDNDEINKSPYHILLQKVLSIKPKFAKKNQSKSNESRAYKDVLLPAQKVELALQYYLQHIEEFTSPKFEKKYLWTELANFVSEPVNKLFNKVNYLKQYYNPETNEVAGEKTLFGDLLNEIIIKEQSIITDPKPLLLEENEDVLWSDEETEQLLAWYLTNLEKFKNPKYVRKYLWIEASTILGKSPLACSKKMTEIRTQYKTMIKVNPEELNDWRFYNLCQKIYGTGKKSDIANIVQSDANI